MIATPQDIAGWMGRELFDPYDVRIGQIADLRRDALGGEPVALVVALADGDTREVPVAGAVPSGRAIRTPYTAAAVLAGEARPPAAPAHPHAVQSPTPPAAGTRDEMVAALRDTHAALRATLERLAALRWRVEDAELVHDLTFHHTDVEGHAADVRRRLAELQDERAPLRDGVVKLGAWLHVKRRMVTSRAATADAQEAVDLARDEWRTWVALAKVARRCHDAPTARLADRGRDDATALLYTVAASWPRFVELDRQRRGTSAFAPPPDLAELAPTT
jgi:hypothetical protein